METIYTFKGKVVSGKKIGRSLGFPTANLIIEHSISIEYGVYIASIYLVSKKTMLESIVNVGVHPSFPEGPPTIEAYILDKDIDLYDQELIVYFHKKLRKEIKFENKTQLIAQITYDVECARKYFK